MLTGFLLMAIGAAMILWGSAEVWMPVFDDWLRGARNVWDELVKGWRTTNEARDEDMGFRYGEEDRVAWDGHRRASRDERAATWREDLARDDAT